MRFCTDHCCCRLSIAIMQPHSPSCGFRNHCCTALFASRFAAPITTVAGGSVGIAAPPQSSRCHCSHFSARNLLPTDRIYLLAPAHQPAMLDMTRAFSIANYLAFIHSSTSLRAQAISTRICRSSPTSTHPLIGTCPPAAFSKGSARATEVSPKGPYFAGGMFKLRGLCPVTPTVQRRNIPICKKPADSRKPGPLCARTRVCA